MNHYAQMLLQNWHPMRIIYLIVSVMLLVQAAQAGEGVPALLGSLFLYQAIFNTGCCGMSGGFRNAGKEISQESIEDTEYTEIK